ncbi:MAG: hypothetical protein EOM19_05580 [Candidatus Moranbacteria bacterium]|nr:hypothetical protein [Candidatus Moranbacteria bacterium]
MKKMYWWKMILVSTFFFFGMPLFVLAKSYSYESIDITIDIRKDTTFLVRETQTFQFSGEFHKGYRQVFLKDIDTRVEKLNKKLSISPILRPKNYFNELDNFIFHK